MTPKQEQHLKNIKDSFVEAVDKKYRAGQEEHGGNLFEMPKGQLLQEIEQEIIDLWVYFRTLKERDKKKDRDE